MRLTIDKRPNGFRVQWQDGKGQQGRAQFSTEVAMRDFLSRFDFVNGLIRGAFDAMLARPVRNIIANASVDRTSQVEPRSAHVGR